MRREQVSSRIHPDFIAHPEPEDRYPLRAFLDIEDRQKYLIDHNLAENFDYSRERTFPFLSMLLIISRNESCFQLVAPTGNFSYEEEDGRRHLQAEIAPVNDNLWPDIEPDVRQVVRTADIKALFYRKLIQDDEKEFLKLYIHPQQ